LLALVRRHGQVVTKDELMASVWRDTAVEENSLNVQVSALRKAFGERPHEPDAVNYLAGVTPRFSNISPESRLRGRPRSSSYSLAITGLAQIFKR